MEEREMRNICVFFCVSGLVLVLILVLFVVEV